MIDEADLGLFRFADTAEDAWEELLKGGLSVGEPAPGAAQDVRESCAKDV